MAVLAKVSYASETSECKTDSYWVERLKKREHRRLVHAIACGFDLQPPDERDLLRKDLVVVENYVNRNIRSASTTKQFVRLHYAALLAVGWADLMR